MLELLMRLLAGFKEPVIDGFRGQAIRQRLRSGRNMIFCEHGQVLPGQGIKLTACLSHPGQPDGSPGRSGNPSREAKWS